MPVMRMISNVSRLLAWCGNHVGLGAADLSVLIAWA
jgi:hypothetical protein